MRKTLIFAVVLSLALATWLTTASPAEAATYRPWRRTTPVVGPTRHMPGWDWRRTYPWSPYNYGRNPYNPIVVPYPYYVDPYPVYSPLPPAVTPMPVALTLPAPSGPLAAPPPGTALVRVQVPNTWAQVSFDGHDSYTNGTQRYFVTPRLDASQTYDVGASWDRYGQPVQQHRIIHVLPGQTSVVTFGR